MAIYLFIYLFSRELSLSFKNTSLQEIPFNSIIYVDLFMFICCYMAHKNKNVYREDSLQIKIQTWGFLNTMLTWLIDWQDFKNIQTYRTSNNTRTTIQQYLPFYF